MLVTVQIEVLGVISLFGIIVGDFCQWPDKTKLDTTADMVPSFTTFEVTSDARSSNLHTYGTDAVPVLVA